MKRPDIHVLGRNLIVGTAGDDSLLGTDRNDLIKGLGGNDSISGGTGNDRLVGGDGDDQLLGNGGDMLLGGAGNDFIRGGAGDLLDGGVGTDQFVIDFWNDTSSETLLLGKQAKGKMVEFVNGTRLLHFEIGDLTLGSGNDLVDIGKLQVNVWAGSGDDQITNHGSADVQLHGDDGNDTIAGGHGEDWVFGGLGDDVLSGGAGNDWLDYTDVNSGVTVNLALSGAQNTGGAGIDTISGFENLRGTYNSDALTGDEADNYLDGTGGHDTLVGGGGNDTLFGSHSAFPPGGDETTLIGGAGQDVMWSGKDSDTFIYQALSDSTDSDPDLIEHLNDEGVGDLIDLSAIDADATKAGNQAFHRVSAFTHHTGELVMTFSVGSTWLTVDVDGDAQADMTIQIEGDHTDFTGLVL